MMSDCVYECGAVDPHKCCTHQDWCIFSPKRIEFERQLGYLLDKRDLYHRDVRKLNIVNDAIDELVELWGSRVASYYRTEVI